MNDFTLILHGPDGMGRVYCDNATLPSAGEIIQYDNVWYRVVQVYHHVNRRNRVIVREVRCQWDESLTTHYHGSSS